MSNLAQTVERTILLDAAPEEVWEALTDEAALSEWLAPEVELEPREGGALRCRYEDGEERRGEVELIEEAERLAFRWWRDGTGPSRVELTLVPVADGTLVTVVESTVGTLGWGPRLGALRGVVGRLALA